MVCRTRENTDRLPCQIDRSQSIAQSTSIGQKMPQTSQVPQSTMLQSLRERYKDKGISEQSADLLSASWREGTVRNYDTYISKWKKYTDEENISFISPTLAEAINFLSIMFRDGYGYSAICAARSALSNLLEIKGCGCFGEHPLVKRLVKGIYEKRPALPKYSETWEVDQVLNYFNTQSENLTLKELTYKLILLMAILTGQRCQTLHLLDIANMNLLEDKCVFFITKLVKQSKPGRHIAPIELLAFPQNRKLCVISTLKIYLEKTRTIRGQETNLFISFAKPFKAVSKDTLSRWIKESLRHAGIDTAKYSAHSTRAASTTAACKRGLSVENIMKAAGWSRSATFSKYYQKKTENLAQGLLDAYK